MRRALLAAVLAFAPPAFAYMPPEAYIALRADATQHVQLFIDKVGEPPAPGFGDCPLGGRVARIFRDRGGTLADGMALTATVPCMRTGATDMMPGPTNWTNLDELRTAAVVELYLLADGDGYRIADHGDGLRLLEAPTEAPVVVDKPQP